jgi:hypothetical protein
MRQFKRGITVLILLMLCVFPHDTLSANTAVDTAKDKIKHPNESIGPTEVSFFIFVLDIDDIDSEDQSFHTNVFISLSWTDKRLVHEGDTLTMPLTEIWNPELLLENPGGIVLTAMPEVADVESNGSVTYRQRYTGTLSQQLKLTKFPFDQHKFAIQFIVPGSSPKDIKFVQGYGSAAPTVLGGGIYHDLSLPDWKVIDHVIEERPLKPVGDVEVAGFVLEFTAKRYAIYYTWQVIIPLVLIVMMAWGAFYIDPTYAGAQVTIATSSMLTLIAYRFMLGNFIPHLPYMTRLDYFTLGSTVLVFLTLVEVIITTNLALKDQAKIARKIDNWCRFIFPIIFTVWSFFSLAFF